MFRLLNQRTILFLFLLLIFSLVLSNRLVASNNDPIVGDPTKSIVGTVSLNDETPIINALIVAHRIDRNESVETVTNSEGRFELIVSQGLWSVTVVPTDSAVPNNWIYPKEPYQVSFNPNSDGQIHEIHFAVVPTDGVIFGEITLPNGTPPHFPVIVSFRNGEGIGKEFETEPGNGAFEVELPHGRYDINIHPQNDSYAGPILDPVHLYPNGQLNLGTIPLLARDAMIQGKVVNEQGDGVEGIPVVAWHNDRPASILTETDANGNYGFTLVNGRWAIEPAPTPDQPYLYLGEPEVVIAEPGQTVEDVNFELVTADALITGALVNGQDEIVAEIEGWATAVHTSNDRIQNGAPVREGEFGIKIPSGEYRISIYLPPGSKYVVLNEPIVQVESGSITHVRILVEARDANIYGGLLDPRQDQYPVTNVPGTVTGWNGESWTSTHIRPDQGTYELNLFAGVWQVDYAIDHEKYVKLDQAINIPLESGQSAEYPLPITLKDSAISGQVFAPNGEPLPGAIVIVNGLTGDVDGLRLRMQTDDNGRYRIAVPYGRYRVGAKGGEPSWINPIEPIISVEPNTVVEGVDLHFLEPDTQIQGTLTVHDTQFEGEVLIWAWSNRGGFTKARFPVELADDETAVGDYRIGVVSGATWRVGAIFETEDAYWVGRSSVRVPEDGAKLDLDLYGPFPKPTPRVVVFDASEPQRITLADGTALFIPAGAMPVEGRVTLRIVPIATLPHQNHAQVIQYGYAIFATDSNGRPIEEQFNHDVLIRFKFDERDFNGRFDQLKPAYFSTTSNEWTFPNRYVINKERQWVVMAVDHFTEFALVQNVNGEVVYLPVIAK